ncbi:MAG: hypothetical protein ACRDIY_19030 [Chloroflexota bacterium]
MALDPIKHTLTNLLTGYGYNLYEGKNRARADDLLVREKAAEMLSDGQNALRDLRTSFQKRFIPPLTRENPSPPAERMAQLREIATLGQRVEDLATRIRSMSVPTQDRVWERFRGERATLLQLLQQDYNLISPCKELRDAILALTPGDWNDSASNDLQSLADRIEHAIRDRAEFLRVPGW